MALARVLAVAALLAFALCRALTAAQVPGQPVRFATVSEWADVSNYTLQMVVTAAAAPELLASYEDPAWTGTVFAIQDRVWEVMARMDGQGTFDNMLYQIESNATYQEGFKKIVEYNVVPGEALTHADLAMLAADQQPLSTLLEGQDIGTMLEGSTVTLVPTGQEIGNVTVLPNPDVFAGNATVIYLPVILLPRLMPA